MRVVPGHDPNMTTQHPSDWLETSHAATDHPIIVVVGERRLIAIDGVGGPRGADYRLASETLKNGLRNLRARLAHGRQVTWGRGGTPSRLGPSPPLHRRH